MPAAIGAVDGRDLSALAALHLTRLRGLAALSRETAVARLATDAFVSAAAETTHLATYNRLGRVEEALVARPLSEGQVEPLRHQRFEQVYTPDAVRRAYGFDKVTQTGRGQTIAIPTAYHSPDLREDLRVFNRAFNLPDVPLEIVNQRGGPPGGAVDPGWAVETALDVQWAHAAAPGAKILVVEADSASLGDVVQAIDTARRRPDVSVVSMSFGIDEFAEELRFDAALTTPRGHRGITFVAASGDDGAGTLWPSVSPNVLSVGGTSLAVTPTGRYAAEVAWSGSGGGVSVFEPQPTYQNGVQDTGRRGNPDVSYNADPRTGFAVYRGEWQTVGGTSAAAPQWAGLIAVANEKRAARGYGPVEQAQRLVYSLPASDFRDVTLGGNGYLAGVGYDYATGRGSPVVDRLVADLARPVVPDGRTTVGLRFVTVGGLLYPVTRS